jgi:hypothetical protein
MGSGQKGVGINAINKRRKIVMNWFNDLKIGTKLITGFTFMAFITALVGVFGICNIKKIENLDMKLYEKITVPISDFSDVGILSTHPD